jgi:hypothetical protein
MACASGAHETLLLNKCYLIEVLLQFLICIINTELFKAAEIMICQFLRKNK